MSVIRMNRRRFLLFATLMSPLPWMIGSSCVTRQGGYGKCGVMGGEFKSCILGLFGDLDSPGIIGRRYLDLYPREKQSALLMAVRIQSSEPSTSDAVRELIARDRANDFLNDEVVIIDGWLLSRTEVQVCALTVLL